MKLQDKIIIKATIIPVHALRCIKFKIPLLKCRCWCWGSSTSKGSKTSCYSFKNKSRYSKIIKDIEWV